jgi:hypothetical protein
MRCLATRRYETREETVDLAWDSMLLGKIQRIIVQQENKSRYSSIDQHTQA